MISMDKLIQFAMDSTMQFKSEKDELIHLQKSETYSKRRILNFLFNI